MDVGPFVISHAQAAKLAEPGKGPLHDPPPPAQATPMRRAAHSQHRHDVASPEAAPNGGRIAAAIPEHTIRPLPWSPACAVHRGNRIHQRQSFLRVVPIRAGQTHRERHTAPVADQMPLPPRLARSAGFGPVRSPPYAARIEQLSTTARDQSIWSERASQSSSAK